MKLTVLWLAPARSRIAMPERSSSAVQNWSRPLLLRVSNTHRGHYLLASPAPAASAGLLDEGPEAGVDPAEEGLAAAAGGLGCGAAARGASARTISMLPLKYAPS